MIAIKDIEMPNDCCVCPFTERIPPGRTRCLLTCRILAENYNAPLPERNKYCPLVDIKGLRERKGETMDSLISRQAAIDAVLSVIPYDEYWKGQIEEAVGKLPSAQPERTKRIIGKSINGMTMWYQCESCNEPVDEKDLFCSGCGRRFEDG